MSSNISEDINIDLYEIHVNILKEIENNNTDISKEIYLNTIEPVIKIYKDIIKIPIKTSFIKKNNKDNKNDKLKEIHNIFTNEVKTLFQNNYYINNLFNVEKGDKKNYKCECGNENNFVYKQNYSKICEECGLESELIVFNDDNYSYASLQHINLNQKYKYEKICHFRDTINQFQAKQNKYIPKKVFDDLEDMIIKHGLKNINSIIQKEMYAKVTKKHIRDFLSETNNNKYYEDIQLLWCKITGNKPPDISNLEKKLYDDFNRLVDVFLSLNNNREETGDNEKKRKNFLNSQYILKQLLRRYNYKVDDSELSMLKTPARLREHDEIYEKCCERLSWTFQPL
jgi:hypothetical protein